MLIPYNQHNRFGTLFRVISYLENVLVVFATLITSWSFLNFQYVIMCCCLNFASIDNRPFFLFFW